MKRQGFNLGKWIAWAAWIYLFVTTGAWIALRLGGDRWWPATLMLFGPRWILSLPLLVLVPLAGWKKSRLLFVLLPGAGIVFGPFMGFCMPLQRRPPAAEAAVRVLTCNVDNGNIKAAALVSLITASGADIIALQECPNDIPANAPPNWHVLRSGALAILSRFPLRPGKALEAMHPPHQYPRASLLEATVQMAGGAITFCTVHLPSPRYGLSTILDRYRIMNFSRMGLLSEERTVREDTSRQIKRIIDFLPGPTIVAGDFNMPADSIIYRQYWGGYANAFETAGFGYGLTERAEVRGFEFGVRIDHILTGEGLRAVSCRVGPDIGSDHLPLTAEIDRK